MKKILAFTLGELMIVLVVIGVLAVILLPIITNSIPDESVLKFKKANSLLLSSVKHIAASDKYNKFGDLGKKRNGDDVTGAYLCNSMSDVLSNKEAVCRASCSSGPGVNKSFIRTNSNAASDTDAKKRLDKICADIQRPEAFIRTSNGIVFYEACLNQNFATKSSGKYIFPDPYDFSDDVNAPGSRIDGFDVSYKVFCIDVDRIGDGEPSFGYGIRRDGKILLGERADEWVLRTSKKEEND